MGVMLLQLLVTAATTLAVTLAAVVVYLFWGNRMRLWAVQAMLPAYLLTGVCCSGFRSTFSHTR
jgi:hypothetical protein